MELETLKKQISAAANRNETLYQKLVAVFVTKRRGSLPNRWKETPHTDMYFAKKNGKKSTIFNNQKDLKRVRIAAQSTRVIGAAALLIDVAMAGTAIKQAYDSGGNTTRVAFEEIGGITIEASLASLGAVAASAALAPFVLLPGVGLLIIVAVGASGAVLGNIAGKEIGLLLYDHIVNPLANIANSNKFDSLKAI